MGLRLVEMRGGLGRLICRETEQQQLKLQPEQIHLLQAFIILLEIQHGQSALATQQAAYIARRLEDHALHQEPIVSHLALALKLPQIHHGHLVGIL
jgi:hypothetical protein